MPVTETKNDNISDLFFCKSKNINAKKVSLSIIFLVSCFVLIRYTMIEGMIDA